MGYIEETGAAQYLRDARILAIYEGTNGVQAQDLLAQKILRDKGAAAEAFFTSCDTIYDDLKARDMEVCASAMHEGLTWLRDATRCLLSAELYEAGSVSVPYLRLWGIVAGGSVMFKKALAAAAEPGMDYMDDAVYDMAHFYASHIMPEISSLGAIVMRGPFAADDYTRALGN
jgi:hypothetical protein